MHAAEEHNFLVQRVWSLGKGDQCWKRDFEHKTFVFNAVVKRHGSRKEGERMSKENISRDVKRASPKRRIKVAEGVYRRGGAYYVVVREPDPLTSKTKPVWRSGFRSLGEAKAFRDSQRSDVREGRSVVKRAKTVGEYLLEWLPSHVASRGLKPSTVETYNEQITVYLIPRIGHIQLQALTATDVEKCYLDLLASGGRNGQPLSSRTVRLTGTVLRMALTKAVKTYKFISSSPADDVELPAVQDPEKPDAWNAEEMRSILKAASQHRLWAYFVIAAASGARRGELLALRWHDINLTNRSLTFSKNLVALRGSLVEGTLKNGTKKVVIVDPVSLGVLQSHRRRQAQEQLACPEWAGDDRVFVTAAGRPIHPRNINRIWQSIMKQAGVRYFKPHTLRHTQATILLEAGVPLHVVAKRLGHKDALVTATVYAKVTAKQEDESSMVFGDWLQSGESTDEDTCADGAC
jgi:integrase